MAGSLFCLIAALACGFEVARRPRQVKGLASGLQPLLMRGDLLWIGGLGVALPWVWWWVTTRLTPLGLRDISLLEWDLLPWPLQTLLGWILGAALLLQTVQWRWAKRGAFLALDSGSPRPGRVAVVLAALALPAVGVVRYLGLGEDKEYLFMLGVAAAGGFALLWLLWAGLMNLITPATGALQANLVSRAALPWFLTAAALMLAAIPVLKSAERNWLARDTLATTTSGVTQINGLRDRAARELRERMGLAHGNP